MGTVIRGAATDAQKQSWGDTLIEHRVCSHWRISSQGSWITTLHDEVVRTDGPPRGWSSGCEGFFLPLDMRGTNEETQLGDIHGMLLLNHVNSSSAHTEVHPFKMSIRTLVEDTESTLCQFLASSTDTSKKHPDATYWSRTAPTRINPENGLQFWVLGEVFCDPPSSDVAPEREDAPMLMSSHTSSLATEPFPYANRSEQPVPTGYGGKVQGNPGLQGVPDFHEISGSLGSAGGWGEWSEW